MPFVEFVKICAQVPAFHLLANRLQDRINRLSTIYCTEEKNLDQPAFGERSEQVKMQKVTDLWVDKNWRARSGRWQWSGKP